MKVKLVVMLSFLLLAGCCSNPFIYPNYCAPDYWHDNDWNIFGRKNCVGQIGVWHDYNNGRDGYWCTSSRCVTYERLQCTDTCNCS